MFRFLAGYLGARVLMKKVDPPVHDTPTVYTTGEIVAHRHEDGWLTGWVKADDVTALVNRQNAIIKRLMDAHHG